MHVTDLREKRGTTRLNLMLYLAVMLHNINMEEFLDHNKFIAYTEQK